MIFVDSSFWIASRASQDDRHEEAARLAGAHRETELVTSNHVRSETWTFLRRRQGHEAAVTFLDLLERSPRIGVVSVGETLEEEALSWLRRHDEREYSFVDATSFALMRSLA